MKFLLFLLGCRSRWHRLNVEIIEIDAGVFFIRVDGDGLVLLFRLLFALIIPIIAGMGILLVSAGCECSMFPRKIRFRERLPGLVAALAAADCD